MQNLRLIFRILGMFWMFVLEQSALQLWKAYTVNSLAESDIYYLFKQSESDANMGKILQNTFPACVSFIGASEKIFIIVLAFNKFKFWKSYSDNTFKKNKKKTNVVQCQWDLIFRCV